MTKKLNFQNIILEKLFLKNNINFNFKGYLFEIIIINYVQSTSYLSLNSKIDNNVFLQLRILKYDNDNCMSITVMNKITIFEKKQIKLTNA